MEKNYLSGVVWIVLASLLALLCMFWLPGICVGDWKMRKVDMLSDLRSDSALWRLAANDPLVAQVVNSDYHLAEIVDNINSKTQVLEGSRLTRDSKGNVMTLEDSIILAHAQKTVTREGVTSIIDMSNGGSGGMKAFYHALDQAGSRPVRIAVLGDSFIEGDILTSMLRELLQQRFGGSGAGYMPMTSITAGFRNTVNQTFEGWNQHKAVDRSGFSDTYNNLSGNYFTASQGAWVNMIGKGNNYSRCASCTSSSFYFFGNTGNGYVTAVVNGTDTTHFSLNTNTLVGHATVTGDIRSVRWSVTNPENMVFLGASMDSETGVIVDNYAMRSARGNHISRISPQVMSAFNNVRHYDLVILMYGLNVAESNKSAYTAYCNTIIAAVNNIKANMPGTSVLIVGCSDREERFSGGWRTMRGVLGLIQAQERAAIDAKVAFWDLYLAMGGEGSIVKMVKHGEANSDYTHINSKGGNRIARYLYDALMLGYENR
ncbi:MAG: hypothetical protein IKW83_04235 [Muribaculaceae bacterium]|nr:hypothetical protein [Muribaculaceae bacterium]